MRLIPLAAFVAATLTLAVARATDVPSSPELSRTQPEAYEQHISGLLTKLADVLPGRTAFPADDTGGVVLLSEYISYRDGDGTLYRVSHVIYHAVTEAAVEQLASDTYHFDRERETIFLVDAATIHPDGRRQPVEAKGAFIQTPQRAARSSLYTSDAELNLIFPNIARGACTEAIVVVRENTPVIPGHFSAVRTFSGGWPSYLRRQVVDFPEAEMRRVHVLCSPAGIPDAAVESHAPGRERRTWSMRSIPRLQWEERSPGIEFCAPTLWLTTLDDWDTVAAWFQGLVADRSELGPELEAAVATWTEGLSDRRAIIDALTTAVANEVRYTGLEFGLAGYQPYPCRDVWARRYGDCKDKANLLRALLANKGIRAHVVLLSTENLGLIEKASPSWRQFNHAIVAIEDAAPGGGYIFCDPTAKNLPAGSLGLSDIGREVLVVRDGRAEWTRTPDVLESAIRVSADLALAANGELSGWFTLAADGTDAAGYAAYYNSTDHDDRVRDMQRTVEKFFPGANVMDVDYTPDTGAVRHSKLRSYFVRPARAAKGESLRMPYPADWLPSLTTVGERRLPYETTRRTESVDVTISLPEGWSAATVPVAFSAPSAVGQFEAAWSAGDGRVTAHLAWHPESLALGAKDYAVFQRSVRALTAWLEQPLLLAHSGTNSNGTSGVVAPEASVDLRGFPILATGEGQLRLVEEKFSDEKNPARRAALEKVLQWFPSEPDTRFEAEAKLALLDWKKNGDRVFADTIAALLARLGEQVSIANRSWGEYLQARAAWDASHDPAAIETLKRLARDETVSPYRRGWSAQLAALDLSKDDPGAAAALLKPYAGEKWDAQKEIVATLAECLARAGDVDGLLGWGAEFAQAQGTAADALFKVALERQREKWSEFPLESQAGISAAWTRVVVDATQFPEAFPALQKLRGNVAADDARRAFTRDLAAWLAEHPPAWWTREKSPRFADADAAIEQIKKANDASDGAAVVDAWLQLVLHYEPEFPQFAEYARWSLWWLDHRDNSGEEALLNFIGSTLINLPAAASSEVVSSWSTFGDHLEKKGDIERARSLFKRAFDATDAETFERVKGGGRLGLLELRANRVDEALAAFREIEPLHTQLAKGADYLYAALLVHLERGEFDRGLELLASIGKQEDRYIKECKYAIPLEHLLRLAQKPERLKYYWQRRDLWRPAWDELLTNAGVKPAAINEPPLVEDYGDLSARIAHALSARDTKEFLHALDVYMHLAQWIPMFTTDASQQAAKSSGLSSKLQRSIYECLLSSVAGLEPVDPQFDATGRMWEAAFLVDTDRPREGAIKAKALLENLGLGEKLGEAGLRIWVAAARGLDLEAEANEAARAALDGSATLVARVDLLRILSDSYLVRGDADANRVLLDRETRRPDFPAKTETGRLLLARLDEAKAAATTAGAFSRGVQAWRARHDLAWLDTVKPLSLDDPRFASRKAPFLDVENGLTSTECLKFNLLLALDERQPQETRETAFRMFVYNVAFATNDPERFVGLLQDAIESETCSPTSCAVLIALGVNACADAWDLRMLDRLNALPAFRVARPAYQASVASVAQALALIEKGQDDWGSAAFAVLTKEPVDFLRAKVVETVLLRLVYAGRAEEADALIAKATTLATDSTLGTPAASVRLRWTRAVQGLKSQLPFLHGVRDLLLARTGTSAPTPTVLRGVLTARSVGRLSVDERFALVMDAFRSGRGLPAETSNLFRALNHPASIRQSDPRIGPAIVDLALKTNMDDQSKADWVFTSFLSMCDYDRPEVRTSLEKLARAFTSSAAARNFPQTRQMVALMRAALAMRASSDSKPAALFADFDASGAPPIPKTAVRMMFHFTRGQNDACLALADKIDPAMASGGAVYFVVRTILSQAGRSTEVQLLEEAGRSALERAVIECALHPDNITVVREALELTRVPGANDLMSEAWFERVLAANVDDVARLYVRLSRAKMQNDPKSISESADALLQVAPDFYEIYFARGAARLRLGDRGHARDDLRIFLQHCLDSVDYPEALALFRKLAPKEKIRIAP